MISGEIINEKSRRERVSAALSYTIRSIRVWWVRGPKYRMADISVVASKTVVGPIPDRGTAFASKK